VRQMALAGMPVAACRRVPGAARKIFGHEDDVVANEELLLAAGLEVERGTVKGIVDTRAVAGHVGITKEVKGRRGGDIHRRRASEELAGSKESLS
jgi:hypothetical protein